MNLIDLHIHSTNSDGELSIKELEQLSIEKKLEVVSFTDHNYLNNYESNKLKVLKGVELDCEFDMTKMHILFYNYINDKLLSNKISEIDKKRLLMTRKLLDNIYYYYGIHINNDDLHIKNKRDIIKWFISNGYGDNPDVIADTYTSSKSICYVPNVNLRFEDMGEFIGEKTIVSLAHPDAISSDLNYLNNLIYKLKKHGLNAIEVVNLKHTIFNYQQLLSLATNNNLISTFGSDFHRKNDKIGVECESKFMKVLLK